MENPDNTHEYLSFAEKEYNHIVWAYGLGCRDGVLAVLGQSACEKYLKDLIAKWYIPPDAYQSGHKRDVLRSQSLRVLTDFISSDMDIRIPGRMQKLLRQMEIYLFCEYPGDKSFFPTEEDATLAKDAAVATREFVLSMEHELEVLRDQREAEQNQDEREENPYDDRDR